MVGFSGMWLLVIPSNGGGFQVVQIFMYSSCSGKLVKALLKLIVSVSYGLVLERQTR